ncbi:hypothetical protein D3C76_1286800 [compost metagenome]
MLDQFAAHFVAQLGGFLVGAGQVVLVVQVDLLHLDLVGDQQQVVAAAHFVAEGVGQLVLGAARGAGVAGGALGDVLAGQDQVIGRAGHHFHAAAFQNPAQILDGLAVGVACGNVDFLQRKVRLAQPAQVEAAGGQHGGHADQRDAGQDTFHQASLTPVDPCPVAPGHGVCVMLSWRRY